MGKGSACDMDADQTDARARAEARRAKILARQKDRLSSITGVYGKQEEPAGGCDIGSPPTKPSNSNNTPVGQEEQASTEQQQQQQPQQGRQHAVDQTADQEQLRAIMATLERQLQHAQAMATSPEVASQPADLLLQQLGASGSRPARQGAGGNPAEGPTPTPGQAREATTTAAAATADAQSPPQQPPFLLQLGPSLARSVKQTQLFRLLAAMLLAYAALTGWPLGLPPVVLLVLTDLAVVLAGAAVLPAPKAAEGGGGGGGSDLKVPWRLRSFDLVSLVPGLRELLDSLSGYNAVATAVSQDFAAYVVACGLLLTTSSVPAAVSWGLRF